MFIKLSEYYYTNKFIPVSTDSTVLKIVKVSGLIFLGPIAFLFDYGLKFLADRNSRQKKDDLSDLSALLKNTLGNTGKIQDTPSTVEQVPIETEEDKHSEILPAQEKALGVNLPENTSTAPEVPPVVEQVFTMPADKYSMSLAAQEKTLETGLLSPVEKIQDIPSAVEKTFTKIDDQKYILSLAAQKKTLEKCLKDFKTDPKNFSMPIHQHLVKVIERLFKKYPNDELPNDYKEHTRVLRGAISTKEYKNNKYLNIALIIQELCFAKFVYTVLTDLEEEILKNAIGFDSSRNMTNISKQIKEDNKILSKQRKTVRQSILLNYEKGRNAAGINSDQLCSANIPELRSIHRVEQGSEPYDVYYIRYPTPTIETTKSFYARVARDNATTIAPEFIGFLDSIQRKKISFLHVNHQYMDKEDNDVLRSADNNRAEAIQKLEETHEVFHFLSLPFDGPVIEKIDIEKNLTKWKQNLVSKLIEKKEGFKLPKKFREAAVSKQQEIEQLLDELHKRYFSGKKELNKTERRVLLVVFYYYL